MGEPVENDVPIPSKSRLANAWTTLGPKRALVLLGSAGVLLAFLAFGELHAGVHPPSVYLPLHTVLELVAAMVGLSMFVVQWHAAAARELREPRALFLGAAFLAVAGMDLLHVLAFPGMPGVLGPGTTDRGIIYWLAARLWQVTALLIAGLLPEGRGAAVVRRGPLLALNLAVVSLPLALDALRSAAAPLFFVEGRGLSPLKVSLEYAVMGLAALAAGAHLRRYRRTRDEGALTLFVALTVTVLSESCFTLYANAYDSLNLLGHLYKGVAYLLIFDALFVAALLRPYRRLDQSARELAASNSELGRLRDHVQNELTVTIARLRALERITEVALSRLEPDALLAEMLRRICDGVGADTASLLLLTREGSHLELRASVGLADGGAPVRIPRAQGLAGRIAESRAPLVVADLAQEQVLDPWLPGAVRSLVGVPLLLEGEVIGVLHAGTFALRAFDPEDVRLLERAADRVATSLDRARVLAELQTIVSSVPDPLLLYSPEGEIVRMNAAAEAMFGYSAAERGAQFAARLQALDIRSPDGVPVPFERQPLVRVLRGEETRGELLLLRRGGKDLWVSASAAPIRAASGGLLGAMVTLVDITPLHELQEQREDLLRAVTHDLRTPLAAIQLQAQRLQRLLGADERGGPDARTLQGLQTILVGTRRMNLMIQDLSDSVRLSAGQLKIETEVLDLPGFVRDLLGRAAGAVDVERVRLELEPDLPSVRGDPARLERIVTNLLTNALKYSAPGTEVVLSASRRGEEVLVSTCDRGPGISAEELPRLFERFYRGARAGQNRQGLGLGLYITRKLVEAHAGRIWAESEPGSGSTFRFTLPIAGPPGATLG